MKKLSNICQKYKYNKYTNSPYEIKKYTNHQYKMDKEHKQASFRK